MCVHESICDACVCCDPLSWGGQSSGHSAQGEQSAKNGSPWQLALSLAPSRLPGVRLRVYRCCVFMCVCVCVFAVSVYRAVQPSFSSVSQWRCLMHIRLMALKHSLEKTISAVSEHTINTGSWKAGFTRTCCVFEGNSYWAQHVNCELLFSISSHLWHSRRYIFLFDFCNRFIFFKTWNITRSILISIYLLMLLFKGFGQ